MEEEEEEKMMRIISLCSCNLDLQLSTPSSSSSSSSSSSMNLHNQQMSRSDEDQLVKIFKSVLDWTCSSSRDQMTVFHNMIGPVCLCDPIELQAIGILLLARREMDKKFNFSRSKLRVPFTPIQLHGPSGLSLKRSLKRFLQKRRDRIQSAMPYKNALL